MQNVSLKKKILGCEREIVVIQWIVLSFILILISDSVSNEVAYGWFLRTEKVVFIIIIMPKQEKSSDCVKFNFL
jgi:hypothetical protein